MDESEHVDDGHGDDGAAQILRVETIEHFSNDLDPVDLIAVQGGGEPQAGAGRGAVDDLEGNAQGRLGQQTTDGDLEVAPLSGANLRIGDMNARVLSYSWGICCDGARHG